MREAKQVLVIYGYYSRIARSNYRESAQRYVSEKREKVKQERTDREHNRFLHRRKHAHRNLHADVRRNELNSGNLCVFLCKREKRKK